MANWKKLQFSGSHFTVGSITASHIPDVGSTSGLNVLTITSDGAIGTIGSNQVNNVQGTTTFTISSSGQPSAQSVSFNASGSTLQIKGGDPNVLGVSASITTFGSLETGSIGIAAGEGYVSSSSQLYGLSHSVADLNALVSTNVPVDFSDFNVLWPASITVNSSTFTTLFSKLNPDSAPDSAVGNVWGNLLNNPDSSLIPYGPAVGQPGGFGQAAERTYQWLSSSFLSGLIAPGALESLSASFSTFTGSAHTNSSSLGTISGSISSSNALTSSLISSSQLSEGPRAFVDLNKIKSKKVFSERLQTEVDQFTITDNAQPLGQGKTFGLNNNLTISGSFSAGGVSIFPNVLLQQTNVSTIAEGIIFGTSSLHNHEFFGNVSIAEGGLGLTGSFIINDSLPDAAGATGPSDDPIQILVHSSNTQGFKRITTLGASGQVTADISSSANSVTQSIKDAITIIQNSSSAAVEDATAISNLETGFNILTGSYSQGIYFQTASNNTGSSAVLLSTTASFSASSVTGSDVLTVSHSGDSSAGVVITYEFNTNPFVNATGIFTSSVGVSASVAALDRYAELTDGVLTGSNEGAFTSTDIQFIADLPEGSDVFFTSSDGVDQGTFSGTTDMPTVVNAATSTTQGVLDFQLDGVLKFGATGSNVGFGDDASFQSLTVDGDLMVSGTLIQVNSTVLNVKDQFILVNSGSRRRTGGTSVDNDKDGGIIVGKGNSSGSLLMFDFSSNSWGFRGAAGSNQVALDATSDDNTTIQPDLTIRTIIIDTPDAPVTSSNPVDGLDLLYGKEGSNTREGTMYIGESSTDVYIFA